MMQKSTARLTSSVSTRENWPAVLIVGVGTALFVIAVAHHAVEIATIDQWVGPVTAFMLDGLPALALAYGGYWLARTDLDAESLWRVLVWCLAGGGLFATVMGLSLLIRITEGRTITEPEFALLLAVDAGGGAGFVAGYYNARAREAIQTAERATDALAFINRMLRHDLRNDAQVVETYAALIETEAEDTDMVRDHAETIHKQTEQAVKLIENTGAIAETLTGDADLERVDVVPIVAESADRVADAFDATVTTDLPESAPVVANEGVRSVVDNLVENAAEHNDADDPLIGIGVELEADTVQIEVRDNGPGVPDDVFDDEDSRGRGLNLVETLVESYGGDVQVRDDGLRGSTFVVTLPRARDA